MFENVISLGFYCGVAQELERIGLRNASYPFDWLISSWSGVEKMLDTNFEGFLNYDDLCQYKDSSSKYRNTNIGVSFFHDFNGHQPLKEQISCVEEKYKRRIERFFESIKKPTLFIRYIESLEEVEFWKNNYPDILQKLKKYNIKNEIYIVNCLDSTFENEYVFYVEPDENDYIARHLFLEKIPKLKKKLLSDELYDGEKREKNLQVYNKKQKEKNSLKNKVLNKCVYIKETTFQRKNCYKHIKMYKA